MTKIQYHILPELWQSRGVMSTVFAGSKSWRVCPWQAFIVRSNIYFASQGAIISTLHFLRKLQMDLLRYARLNACKGRTL